ncbi:hypothetical protein ACFLZ9_02450 [Patescibacteria group bacterium]
MSAPNHGSSTGACDHTGGSDALRAELKWTFVDDCLMYDPLDASYQCGSSTQVKIHRETGTECDDDEPPAYDTYDTGICRNASGPGPNCDKIDWGLNCLETSNTDCKLVIDSTVWPLFDYGQKYCWWVTVWDDLGVSTTEKYASETDTQNDDTDPNTFRSYAHEFPEPYFTWFPDEPSLGEQARFIGSSTNYKADPPGPLNELFFCKDPFLFPTDPERCRWKWEADNSTTDIWNGDYASTTIQFNEKGASQIITLTVTDALNDDIECSTTSPPMEIQKQLPSWEEEKDEVP